MYYKANIWQVSAVCQAVLSRQSSCALGLPVQLGQNSETEIQDELKNGGSNHNIRQSTSQGHRRRETTKVTVLTDCQEIYEFIREEQALSLSKYNWSTRGYEFVFGSKTYTDFFTECQDPYWVLWEDVMGRSENQGSYLEENDKFLRKGEHTYTMYSHMT